LEQTAYNLFIDPLFEAPATGAYLDSTIGNMFLGGAMEGCTTEGMTCTVNAQWNKCIGVDYEQNNGSDITDNGNENAILDCDTFELITIGATATNHKLVGGSHKDIVVNAAAQQTTVRDLVYDRFGSTPAGDITNNAGNETWIENCKTNIASLQPWIGRKDRAAFNQPLIKTDISPTVSPSTYDNTSGYPESVLIAPNGVVTNIDFKRGGIAENVWASTGGSTIAALRTASGMLELSPGDGVVVTFASTVGSTPSVFKYTR